MLYSFQPVYCQICGKVINISGFYDGRVCGPECWKEFNWRKVSSLLGKEYQEKEEQIEKLLENNIISSCPPDELEKKFGGINRPTSEHEARQTANERIHYVEKKIVSIIKESATYMKGVSPTDLLNNFDNTDISQSEARSVMERMIDSGKLWVDRDLMIHYYDWKGESI